MAGLRRRFEQPVTKGFEIDLRNWKRKFAHIARGYFVPLQ